MENDEEITVSKFTVFKFWILLKTMVFIQILFWVGIAFVITKYIFQPYLPEGIANIAAILLAFFIIYKIEKPLCLLFGIGKDRIQKKDNNNNFLEETLPKIILSLAVIIPIILIFMFMIKANG